MILWEPKIPMDFGISFWSPNLLCQVWRRPCSLFFLLFTYKVGFSWNEKELSHLTQAVSQPENQPRTRFGDQETLFTFHFLPYLWLMKLMSLIAKNFGKVETIISSKARTERQYLFEYSFIVIFALYISTFTVNPFSTTTRAFIFPKVKGPSTYWSFFNFSARASHSCSATAIHIMLLSHFLNLFKS